MSTTHFLWNVQTCERWKSHGFKTTTSSRTPNRTMIVDVLVLARDIVALNGPHHELIGGGHTDDGVIACQRQGGGRHRCSRRPASRVRKYEHYASGVVHMMRYMGTIMILVRSHILKFPCDWTHVWHEISIYVAVCTCRNTPKTEIPMYMEIRTGV